MLRQIILTLSLGIIMMSQSGFSATNPTVQDIPTAEIKNGYKKHATLTQLYRWYLIYEEPLYGIENQLDILDKNIWIKSSLGDVKGHDAYREGIKQFSKTWQNAHHIKNTEITFDDVGNTNIAVEISYHNLGALPNDELRSAELSYAMKLVNTDLVLPKFTEIIITPRAAGTATKYISAYEKNRIRSLAHYWFALVEDPSRDSLPFKEILADEFSLDFSNGAITNFEDFQSWLSGPASQVIASTHVINNFSVEEQENDQYQLIMELDWNGILPNKKEMTAKTRHTWIIQDIPTERFARIKSINVEILNSFSLKEKKDK